MAPLVPGQRLRAGLLLLPLLLCFGPEPTGSINPTTLKTIIDLVHRYRPNLTEHPTTQYAVAISLPLPICNGTRLSDLPRYLEDDLRAMKAKLKTQFLYEGQHIVAAKPNKPDEPHQSVKHYQHTEWLMLSLDQNQRSPITRLLDKAREPITCGETEARDEALASNRYENWYPNNQCGWNGCFIFFTYYSPCVGVCLSLKGDQRIPQLMDGIFGAIEENHRALVFKEVFTKDRDWEKQFVWNTWQTLCRAPIYQCDEQACHSCAEPDVNKNYCLEKVRDAPQAELPGKH